MAVVRKEWEDRYDEIKNMPDVPTNEQKKEEWEGKELQFKARLAEIKDTTSPEYKAVIAERKQAKKEFESQQIAYYSVQTYLKANGTNLEAVKKNIGLIDKTRGNRDIYQSLLDELLAAKEANSQIEAKREQIQAEIKKLDEELEELKQQEKDALNAIENFAKTPEQKAAAQSWLEEVRGKIKINQNEFPEKHKELKVELEKPLIEVPENDIKELQEKIDRCNKTCELLLQGKTIGEVYNELGAERKVETPKKEASKVEQPVPEFKPAPDLEGEETGTELKKKTVRWFEPASDLEEEQEEEVVQETVPGFEPAADLEGEQETEGQEVEEQETEEQEEKIPLHIIRIEIDKEGSQATVVRKKETYGALPELGAHGKKTELSKETDKLDKVSKKFPHVDKYVAAEFIRAKNEKLMNPNEMNEQFTIYSNLMKAEDPNEIEELKDKMKLELTYDLRGLRKSVKEKSERNYIVAQAKKAKDLEIAEVTAPWHIKVKWAIQDFAKEHGIDKWIPKNLFPRRNKVEELGEAQQDEEQNTATKPGELSPEEKKTQQEIAKTVAEAMVETATVDQKMSEDISNLVQNDGIEQE